MPPEHAFGITLVDLTIAKEKKNIRGMIRAFLDNNEPPSWIPPHYVADQKNRDFLTNLRIPAYQNGNPSLLLHDLHAYDDSHIGTMFGNSDPMYLVSAFSLESSHMIGFRFICNTSGSGKTRRIMEALTKYWGFYFVAAPDSRNVGVGDLRYALDEVTQYTEWKSDLCQLELGQRPVQSDINCGIAKRLFRKVLAARIVAFEIFLELVIEMDGVLDEKHKRIWLLFRDPILVKEA
jgi:hypothetical protein